VLSMVSTVSSRINIPLFVKIRLLDTIEDSKKLVRQLAKAGACLITIHARYRVNLVGRSGPGARTGPAMLDQVREMYICVYVCMVSKVCCMCVLVCVIKISSLRTTNFF